MRQRRNDGPFDVPIRRQSGIIAERSERPVVIEEFVSSMAYDVEGQENNQYDEKMPCSSTER